METTTLFNMLKIKILSALCFYFFFQGFCQEANTSINIEGKPYSVKVNKAEGEYIITVEQISNAKSRTYTTSSFTSELFNNLLVIAYEDISESPLDINKRKTIKETIKDRASTIFMESIASLIIEVDRGLKIAAIKLKPKSPVYYFKEIEPRDEEKKEKVEAVYKDNFIPSYCQVIFEDGFIRTVIVTGKIGEEDAIFSSLIAYGVTTRKNYIFLYEHRLKREDRGKKSDESQYTLKFGEVIELNRIANVKTTDHSPQNQALLLVPNQVKSLYKSANNKLFELHMFSDFAGVNSDNPNGLIQTEIEKRINIWTWRFGKKTKGHGLFTYLKPTFTLSKIEQNNRTMPLDYFIQDSSTLNFIQPIESYRYRVADFSNELNLYSMQGSVVEITANFIGGWTLTRIKDTFSIDSSTITIDESINSIYFGGGLRAEFHPESRWSYAMFSKAYYLENLNDNFEYRSLVKGGILESRRWLWNNEFMVTWQQPESDNKIFARFSFISELENLKNNFSQIQLGYSIYFKSK